MRLDQREDLFAGHGAGNRRGRRGRRGPARAARAPPASAACVRPTTSSSTPRAASRIAWAMPRRAEAPVRHDAELAQAEQVGAARALRVDLVAELAQRRAQQQPAGLGPRATTSADVADAAQHRLRDALHQLQGDVAGEAVGDDHVGLAVRRSRCPRRCRRSRRCRPRRRGRAGAACASTTSGVPLRRPPRRSRAAPTRGRSTPSTTCGQRRAHEARTGRGARARTSMLAPTSTSVTGCAGDGDRDRERGRWMPRARLMLNRPAASAGPVEPPETSASASPVGDRARGADDRGVGVSSARRATGSAALAIDTGASTTSTPAGDRRRSRAAGPNSSDADALAAAASAAPAATSAGPRSAPLASTATVMVIGGRLLSAADWPTGAFAPRRGAGPRWLVLVVVIVVVHVHDLAPGVDPAHRADPVRPARAVALRARVVRRRGDLVLRAALARCARATASAWGRP